MFKPNSYQKKTPAAKLKVETKISLFSQLRRHVASFYGESVMKKYEALWIKKEHLEEQLRIELDGKFIKPVLLSTWGINSKL